MANGNYEFQSDFAKKHQALGKAEGRAEGKAEGKALGEATAVLKILETRGIRASEEQKSRILACTALPALERWIEKAVSIASVDELFAQE